MSSLISELVDEGFVPPNFNQCNMTVLNQLAKGRGNLVGDKKKKIFLLIDGLGYSLLQRVMAKYPHMKEILKGSDTRKITTVFPSFTITVITSIDSGQTVAEHGLVGGIVPIRETGKIVNVLGNYNDIDAEYLIPRARNIDAISKRYKSLSLTESGVAQSNYSKKTFLGMKKKDYKSVEEFLVMLAKEAKREEYGFIYSYYPLVDATSHRRGAESLEALESAYGFFVNMERILLPALKKSGYNLVITADHGQEHCTRKSVLKCDVKGGIMQYLSMAPWGSTSRSPIVNVLHGNEDRFEREFDRLYGKDALLVNSEELIKSGVFGARKVSNDLRYRFGTHMMLPRKDKVFRFSKPEYYFDKPSPFGHHGGMSKNEMEIPLIVY